MIPVFFNQTFGFDGFLQKTVTLNIDLVLFYNVVVSQSLCSDMKKLHKVTACHCKTLVVFWLERTKECSMCVSIIIL